MVRFKNRYLILSVRAKDGRSYESIGSGLATAIRSIVQQQHGDEFLEAVAPSLQVAFYHHLAGVAILRVGRAQHVKVLQSCLKLSLVDYKGVTVRLLKLTGAFRVAKKSAGDHIAAILAAAQQQKPWNAEQLAAAAVLQEKLQSLYI